MMTLRRRRAWLIGASSGMGLEFGRLLVKAGWTVTISTREPTRLCDAATEIGAIPLCRDVTDRDAVHASAQQVFAEMALELVMVNAGDYR